jgi:tetratricopeptide (TPR) repeat protein
MRNVIRTTLGLAVGGLLLAGAGQVQAAGQIKEWKKLNAAQREIWHGYKILADDKFKAAAKYFKNAGKADPDSAVAFEALGDAYSAAGETEDAARAWKEADDLTHGFSTKTRSARLGKDGSPTVPNIQARTEASYQTAHAYASEVKGEYADAAAEFKAALKADPRYWDAKMGLDELNSSGLLKGEAGDEGQAPAGKRNARNDDDMN